MVNCKDVLFFADYARPHLGQVAMVPTTTWLEDTIPFTVLPGPCGNPLHSLDNEKFFANESDLQRAFTVFLESKISQFYYQSVAQLQGCW